MTRQTFGTFWTRQIRLVLTIELGALWVAQAEDSEASRTSELPVASYTLC